MTTVGAGAGVGWKDFGWSWSGVGAGAYFRLQFFSEMLRSYLSSILLSHTFSIALERNIMTQMTYESTE